MPELAEELAQIFEATANAHHAAFVDTDGADPDWPMWYAEYLHERLKPKLQATFTLSELVYLLVAADRELGSVAPGAHWPTFYANYFIDRYL